MLDELLDKFGKVYLHGLSYYKKNPFTERMNKLLELMKYILNELNVKCDENSISFHRYHIYEKIYSRYIEYVGITVFKAKIKNNTVYLDIPLIITDNKTTISLFDTTYKINNEKASIFINGNNYDIHKVLEYDTSNINLYILYTNSTKLNKDLLELQLMTV